MGTILILVEQDPILNLIIMIKTILIIIIIDKLNQIIVYINLYIGYNIYKKLFTFIYNNFK